MITDFRLKVFITVAKYLSFTKAAHILDITQPAISKHIKLLEADFGEPLFERKGNSISLTSKGVEIIPLIEDVLEKYSLLSDAISFEPNNFEGLLNIGASTTIAQYVLPEILAKFNKQYPKIKISVISANSDHVVKLLKRKEIDIALIEGDNIDNSVHYTPFAQDEIILVSTNKNKFISQKQLSQIPLLIREEGSGTLAVVLTSLRLLGLTRKNINVKMQLGSSESILRYVKASDYYAFISVLVAKDAIERGELVRHEIKDFKITREFRFVSLHGQSGRLVNIFTSFCSSYYNF